MSSWWYATETAPQSSGLNPLLPAVTGIIESQDEATFTEIKKQIEMDLEKEISDSELVKALENGIKLGVLKIKREFKVCKEFTTRELRKIKNVEDNLFSHKGLQTHGTVSSSQGNTMTQYVRFQREQRKLKKRLNQLVSKDFKKGADLSKFLCLKCKRSMEKNKTVSSRLSVFRRVESVGDISHYGSNNPSSLSVGSQISMSPEKRQEDNQEKSRLLVQKNSMETAPPYYDIFT